MKKVSGLANRLKREKYDLCVVLDKHFLWNLFARKVKPKFILGFDRYGEGFSNNLSRSEEHTSELQSHSDLVCRLLLEKKKKKQTKSQIHAK